jgi:hypothetical protein
MININKFIFGDSEEKFWENNRPNQTKKYAITHFHKNGEIEQWEIEAESLEEAQNNVLEDQNLQVRVKE